MCTYDSDCIDLVIVLLDLLKRNLIMRWLINYIRSCFCKHDWEKLSEIRDFNIDISIEVPISYTFIYRCKKCGMVQKIKT